MVICEFYRERDISIKFNNKKTIVIFHTVELYTILSAKEKKEEGRA